MKLRTSPTRECHRFLFVKLKGKLAMPKQHLCPFCSAPLLCHIRQSKPFWYCVNCRQEVPYGIYNGDQLEQQECLNHSVGHHAGFLRLEQDIDELTQLANHYYFLKFINQEWQRLTREQNYLSLILCEISFKPEFEQLYGEVTKYRCLQRIARAISATAKRPADLVARYLFQRFAVLLPNTAILGAAQVAKEIQARIRDLSLTDVSSVVDITPDFIEDLQLNLGLAGIIPSRESSPENLIYQAEKALFQARNEGIEQVVFEPQSLESLLV